MRGALALGLLLLLGAAGIAESADAKCGKRALAVCTKERVEALRRLSAELKQAAATQPPVPPTDHRAVEALNAYNSWLGQQSNRAASLADQGQATLLQATKNMQETQMSFNLQYLLLASQIQHEHRSYTAISKIMKTKHDTAKNSISNVR